jgi:colanic acid biosynthesis protein WcaH
VLGGRVQKNENLDDVFSRLSKNELGVVLFRSKARWLDVYDDFVFGEGVSTHYVVLVYEVIVNSAKLNLPVQQHSEYKWMAKDEVGESDLVHRHSKDYFI